MRTDDLDLSLAISDNPRTRPLIDGLVRADAVRLRMTILHPSEMFWRQLKYADFDVSEMSMSSLLIAAASGNRRWVAIPVFTMRSFFHTWGLVRDDRGIASPADLKGKRVGVPEYQQTSAIWSRGIFQDQFGLNPADVEWYMERSPEKSHGGSTGFTAPPGVKVNQIPLDSDIGTMLANGDLDATLLYLTDPNLVDRSKIDLRRMPCIRPMFPDAAFEGRRYFEATGIYPINHTVVIRRDLLDQNPWIALNLYSAFLAAKTAAAAQARAILQPWIEVGAIPAMAAPGLGQDPMGYGLKSARPTLETIARYLHEQGLTKRQVGLEEVFAHSTLDL